MTDAGYPLGIMVVMDGTARGTILGISRGMILGTILGTMAVITAGRRLGAMDGTAAIITVHGDITAGTDPIIVIMVAAVIAQQHTNASMPIVMLQVHRLSAMASDVIAVLVPLIIVLIMALSEIVRQPVVLRLTTEVSMVRVIAQASVPATVPAVAAAPLVLLVPAAAEVAAVAAPSVAAVVALVVAVALDDKRCVTPNLNPLYY